MALTAAERAKRYREKLKENPKKFEEQRKKQLERLKKNRKRINDLTEEDKESRRKKWREEKKQQKLKKNEKENEEQRATPSSSKSQNSAALVLKIRYKKICRSYRGALENNRKLKLRNEAIRKKLYREKLAHEAKVGVLQKEIEKLTARQEILELSLRETYGTAQSLPEKRLLKSIAVNHVVKTNRSVKAVATCLGLKGRIRPSKKKIGLNKKIQEEIKRFYIRDDISRNTAGKRETKTRGKKKMQIRYLTDTLHNLYEIYRKEGGTHSFTTLFRYKPYYVLSPTAKNRDTCMCVKHSNMEYLFIALKYKNVIDYKNLEDTINKSVCDKNSYACMYEKCVNCDNRSLEYKEEKNEDEITWFRWERVMHTYQKLEKSITTKKTVKQVQKGKVRDLVTEFKAEFSKFKIHYYNWKEQQRQYQICIKDLAMKEIAILVDFSENYDCKLGTEIQSMHFGASKNSITLHCGMIYWNNKSQSFVTISDNTCHEPNAIWAHLLPILQFVKKSDSTIEIIHFFSDGPTSQYRQKKNFFLINLFTIKLKLKYITWSFSESGHGKGVADGIGGAVKRQLDRRVAYGHDVTDADDAYQHLSTSMKSVICFKVSDSDIENINKIIPKDLKAVPQTMKLHQVMSVKIDQIMYRQLSCFCGDKRGLCTCLNPETHSFNSDRTGPDMSPCNKNRGVTTDSINDTVLYDKTNQGYHDVQLFLDINQNAASLVENDQSNCDVQTVSIIDIENEPRDKSGGGIATVTDIAPCSKIDQSDLKIADFTVSPRQKANKTDSVMELNLKVDDILDIDVFDDVIEYPQPGFDLVSDTVDCLTKDDIRCLAEEKENDHKNKRKNNTLASDKGPTNKKVKVLLPLKEEKYKSRSLKTIINRNFTCHMCKIRKLYVMTDMTQCIGCKNWVCRTCCDQPAIDYICDRCFEG